MQTDFCAIEDGVRIKLFPKSDNPLHRRCCPVNAVFSGGAYYCDGARPGWADYYDRDIHYYFHGYDVIG